MFKNSVPAALAVLFFGAIFVASIVMVCKGSLFGFFALDISAATGLGFLFLAAILNMEPLEAAMERKHAAAFERIRIAVASGSIVSFGIFFLILILPFLEMAQTIVLNILNFLYNMKG